MKNIKLMLVTLTLALSNYLTAQVVTPPFTEVVNTTENCCVTNEENVEINQYLSSGTAAATVWSTAPTLANSHYLVDRNIRINSEGWLRISGIELRFAPGKGIIVEKGGRLEIENNAILTASCPTYPWEGIQVKGTASSEQSVSLNQGKVEVSQSTISRAWVAIAQTDQGGGIIIADRCSFTNNPNSISFLEYQLDGSSNEITDCEFEINNDFQDFNFISGLPVANGRTESSWRIWNERTGDASQITIRSNNGVSIRGCRFYNYFSANENGDRQPDPAGKPSTLLWADPDWMGSAIVATESEFNVQGEGNCGSRIRNEFVGWFYGIDAQITNFNDDQITISSCDFTNNKYGVQLANYDVAYIDENTFTIWGGIPNPNDPSATAATDGIWNTYIVTNENYEKGLGAFNNVGVKLIDEFRDLFIRGNQFNTDLEYNFGSMTHISYALEDNEIPEQIVIQRNSFNALIENRPVLANVPISTPSSGGPSVPNHQKSIGTVTGISFSNWEQSTNANHEVFIDCNDFDLYDQGVSMVRETQYFRYDLVFSGSNNVVVDIQSMDGPTVEPLNTFTADYALSADALGLPLDCEDGNANTTATYFAYHIEANFTVNYPVLRPGGIPPLHEPTCLNGTWVNITTATVAHAACDEGIECGDFATNLEEEEAPAPRTMNTDQPAGLEMDNSLNLYPNPASEHMMVQSTLSGTYKVMSLDGREVIHSSLLNEGTNQIDISQLRSGEYILHFVGTDHTEVHKFVKE